jgi:hypothetical protein
MKLFFSILAVCVCLIATAQYKKVGGLSPFGGSGASQTFSFGGSAYINNNFKSPVTGFHITSGRDRPESKWFVSSTLRLFLPANYRLKTILEDYGSNTRTNQLITARTTIIGGIDYDLGRYFISIDDDNKGKLIPFALIGVGLHIGKFKEGTDNMSQLQQNGNTRLLYELDPELSSNAHVRGGLGVIYFFSEKTGIRFNAAYHYVLDVENFGAGADDTKYYGPIRSGLLMQLSFHVKLPAN